MRSTRWGVYPSLRGPSSLWGGGQIVEAVGPALPGALGSRALQGPPLNPGVLPHPGATLSRQLAREGTGKGHLSGAAAQKTELAPAVANPPGPPGLGGATCAPGVATVTGRSLRPLSPQTAPRPAELQGPG